jgi:hypothetical protein
VAAAWWKPAVCYTSFPAAALLLILSSVPFVVLQT